MQAQATTRASANRRLALEPTLTGIGYLALTAIVLAWGVPETDELGRTIDYVREGTFAATLLLTIAAGAALRPALGISRRALGLVALGELLVFVGVLVGLVTRSVTLVVRRRRTPRPTEERTAGLVARRQERRGGGRARPEREDGRMASLAPLPPRAKWGVFSNFADGRRSLPSVAVMDGANGNGMKSYLVEVYQPRAGADVAAARARSAADAVSGAATPVRYVRSIFVPEDETCFHVFESSSKEAVLAATKRAAFAFPRIAEAVA